MWFRRIRFRVPYHEEIIPKIFLLIMQSTKESGVKILKITLRRSTLDNSKIWLWGTSKQKMKLLESLLENYGKYIDEVRL